MEFQEGHIYHIYNQGNNKQKVFFTEENYLFFIKKIKLHVLPYSDILAWCLMPNHFHLMVFVNSVGVTARNLTDSRSTTQSRTTTNQISFNKSIGIMMSSYSRAVNKAKNLSGSLFRQHCKAICLTEPKGISPSWYSEMGVTKGKTVDSNYIQTCFEYIHSNPLTAGLVKDLKDWPYSSFHEYEIRRQVFNSSEAFNTTALLICKNRAEEYGLK